MIDGLRLSCSLWAVAHDDPLAHAKRLAKAGVKLWHWDHTDGVFAATGGFSARDATAITQSVGGQAEAHLMMMSAKAEVDAWCDFCERVVIPIETTDCQTVLRHIERRGVQPAVAVSPDTPLIGVSLSQELPVLVMSVVPGQAGSPLLPSTYQRLAAWPAARTGYLGVDGGITLAAIPGLRQAGATWLVVGSSLTGAPDAAQWLQAV